MHGKIAFTTKRGREEWWGGARSWKKHTSEEKPFPREQRQEDNLEIVLSAVSQQKSQGDKKKQKEVGALFGAGLRDGTARSAARGIARSAIRSAARSAGRSVAREICVAGFRITGDLVDFRKKIYEDQSRRKKTHWTQTICVYPQRNERDNRRSTGLSIFLALS